MSAADELYQHRFRHQARKHEDEVIHPDKMKQLDLSIKIICSMWKRINVRFYANQGTALTGKLGH